MTITIDQAGRVVIPAALRRRAGLKPGTPLSARFEDGEIRITRDVPAPNITVRGNRRVAVPSKPTGAAVDLAALVEEERDRWPQ